MKNLEFQERVAALEVERAALNNDTSGDKQAREQRQQELDSRVELCGKLFDSAKDQVCCCWLLVVGCCC
jgi:hypothetical protein